MIGKLVLVVWFWRNVIVAADDGSSFEIIWSVPSDHCANKFGIDLTSDLRSFGITVNSGGAFQGDELTTFYHLGLYPQIGSSGDINGGIPQLGDLKGHYVRATTDIQNQIPDSNFDGLALIDWEAWRPTWDFNFGILRIYQKRSIQLVLQQHPTWPLANVTAEAQRQWETAAREWMESTLQLAIRLRPKARWCFYGFPDCYNYYGKQEPEEFFCSGNIVQGNNGLEWLWRVSTAICPSTYIRSKQLDGYNLTQRSWFTNGRLKEARRVAGLHLPVFPYTNYFVFDGNRTMPGDDMTRLFGQPAALGMESAVVWGSSNNVRTASECQQLRSYVMDVLGPAAHLVRKNVRSCSRNVCKGMGRCVWDSPLAWRILANPQPKFNVTEIRCLFNPNETH